MNTLNLGSDEIPEKKKKSNTRNLKIALGLVAVILVPTIGSTLAGTIGISTGSIEFGQGSASTLSCQPLGEDVTITPVSALLTSAAFALDSINVSGLNDTCNGKVFRIKLIDVTGGVIIVDAGKSIINACLVQYSSAATTVNLTSACTLVLGTTAGEFTITPSVQVLAGDVYGITIESEASGA
jgi:hypothetical protein